MSRGVFSSPWERPRGRKGKCGAQATRLRRRPRRPRLRLLAKGGATGAQADSAWQCRDRGVLGSNSGGQRTDGRGKQVGGPAGVPDPPFFEPEAAKEA